MAAIDFPHSLRPRLGSSSSAAGAPVPRAGPLVALGVVVCAAAVVTSALGSPGNAAFGRGLLELLIVGVPIAAGVYALRSPVDRRFGLVLLWIGFGWSLTALGETSASIPYTIGRISTWLVFPGVVYLLLAFPDGHIAEGLDRVLFAGVLALLAVLFLGTAPLVEAYPPKTLWATCTTDCPPNALFVLDHEPAFLPKLVLVREWLVEALWLGLFVSMYRRWRAASPLQRRAMGPVFAAGVVLGVAHITFHTARQLGAPTDTVVAISSVWTICIVAVCVAFLVALVRRRTLLADALSRLGAELRAGASPGQVRDALAAVLGDSAIEPLFRDPRSGVWHDADGGRVDWPPSPGSRRVVASVDGDRGNADVALVHDLALRDDRELLDGVTGMVEAAWRHQRTAANLAAAMSDLEDSRRRIAEAADLERARIERDLHDGAQQRLIALRIQLGLAEERLRSDPVAGIRAVHELGFQAELALEELRSLAHGVYPPLLADLGLADALASVARQAPMPVHLDADGVTRHSIEVDSAVYFTCVEALQNAMKHAGEATGVWVTLHESQGTLHFGVRDDGSGFTPTGDGRGLRNMRDRIEAIGGNLTVDAQPGSGTVVAGSVEVRRAPVSGSAP